MNHLGDANKMVSETPRMKAAQMAAMEHMTGDVYRVGCDIERELNAANDRIKRLEEFINRFFDPEDLGYVVSTVVRDDARQSLGMKRVESESRISMI